MGPHRSTPLLKLIESIFCQDVTCRHSDVDVAVTAPHRYLVENILILLNI